MYNLDLRGNNISTFTPLPTKNSLVEFGSRIITLRLDSPGPGRTLFCENDDLGAINCSCLVNETGFPLSVYCPANSR